MNARIGWIGYVAVLAAGNALAQTIQWSASVDGLYTDNAKWDGGAAPTNGQKGAFSKTGTYTITFPQDFTNDLTLTEYNTSNGKITFDTRGTRWIKPTSSVLPSDNTFKMMNGGHSFNLEGTGNGLIQFGLIDAVLSVETTPSSIHTRLESGLFNIYDATGVDDSGTRLVVGHVDNRSTYVTFKEGSASRIRQIDWRARGAENIFTFEGGNHTVFGNFSVMCTDANNRTGQVHVLGGRLDVRNQFNVGGKTNTTGYLLINGGAVHAQQLRTGTDSTARSEIVISNGVLNVRDYFVVGAGANSSNSVILAGGDVTVTNTFGVGQGAGSYSAVELLGGRLETRNNTLIGQNSSTVARLTLSGGTMVATNTSNIVVGNANLSDGEFRVTGGTHRLREVAVSPNGGRGYAEFAGGETLSTIGWVTGANAASTNSVLVVSGGRHVISNEFGIAVGRAGLGYIEISGGEVDCYGYVRPGYGVATFAGYDKANTNRISTLRMTGGILRVLNYPVNVTDASGNASRLALDGGTLAARQIRGWTGAACKGGIGYAELTADGGRVVPLTADGGDIFMETFDLALLGDAGLTVDTDGRNARIPQVFAPKAGASGRLVKIGAGTLYLNSTNTIGRVEVIGGTLAVQKTDAFSGHLTVTNGATLSLQENNVTGLTLEGLTLGDASSSGRLLMDSTDAITITAPNGLDIANGRVFLSDPSVNGAYPLLRCAGTVTQQDIEGIELGNGVSDKDYAWSVVPDGSDTLVVLTISNRAPTTPVAWSGAADDQWDIGANWLTSQPPVKGQTALFPDVAAHKNISVTSGAAAGELAFQSVTPYTLSGEPLTLDNAGRGGVVTVTQGTNRIAAPLVLKRLSTFDISNGSALAVDTVKGDGAILKGGLGLVTLNGSDAFTGGFTVQEGTLTLTSPGAFGTPSPESDRWTLAGGTLRYAGGNAVRNNSIAVDTGLGASDAAAVVDIVADELVLNGIPKVTKGALIKRGAGTLTFNVNTSANVLSASDGKANSNSQQPSYLVAFAENGQAPAGGYSGFNVAEGSVRITSADALATVSMRNSTSIGLQTLQGVANPVLEINHCRVYQGRGGYHFYVGGRTPPNSPINCPALRVLNGAYLETDTLQFGLDASGAVNPEFLVDAARAYVSYTININQPNGGVTSVTLTNKAELAIGGNNFNVNRPISFLADDSAFQVNALNQSNVGLGLINFGGNGSGTFTLRNGARARYARIQVQNAQVAFTFDGGILEPRLNDSAFCFQGDNARQTVELLNNGVTFDIASGLTHTLARNMTGNGKLRKAGAGRLVFAGLMQEANSNNVLLSYTPLNAPIDDHTGGTWVDAGTLAVSNATLRTDRRITVAQGATLELCDAVAAGILAGNGIIAGGTLTQGTLSPGMADGQTGSLTLQGTALNGVTFTCDVTQAPDRTVTASDKLLNVGTASDIIVDFGRTSVDPILSPCSIPIGTYDISNPPGISTWKVKGIGRSGTIGRVEAANGILTADIRFGGFLLIVR